MVIVAQTRVWFLTGGRGQKFRNLPEEERRTQEEEVYARATVALTRAREMCVIFCPLDMKGTVDDSRSASCLPDLVHPTYVLVMPGLLSNTSLSLCGLEV